MKYFTKSQIDEIQKALATWGVRDTDFDDASILRETDLIAIVRDGMNRKISPSVFCKAAAEYVADTLTVKSAYDIAVENGFEGTEEEWLETLFLAQVIDNLNSTDATKALSAKQGKVLKDMINNLPSYTVKSWSQIKNSTIDSDSTQVLANAKTAYELYRRRVSGVNVSWPTLSLTLGDSSTLTANLTHTHPSYEQAIAALQQAVETGTGGSGNASLVDKGSFYTLGVGNVQTDIYSKNQIDGKKISIAGIDAGLGDTITANALRTALGISSSGAAANAILDIGSSYDTLSVTIDGVTTTDTFYNKAQVDALISGGGGGGGGTGTTYKLAGDVEGGNGQTTITTSIVNGKVVEAKIATDAVTTAKIKNLNVTTDKLAANAVTEAKIKDGEVSGLKLHSLAKSITLWGKQFNIGGNTGKLATTITGDLQYVGKIKFVDPLAPTGTTLVGTLEVVNIAGTGQTPVYALHSNLPFYSDGFVSAGGVGSGSGGGGGSLPAGSLGKYLKYVEGTGGAASSWQPADVTLPDIKATSSSSGQLGTDFSTFMKRAFPSAQNNQVLKYNSTNDVWELGVAALPPGTATGQTLRWNNTSEQWVAAKLNLADVANVDLNDTDANYILRYDEYDEKWVATSLSDFLTEATGLDSPSSDQILKYSVSDGEWILSPLPTSAGSITNGNGISISTSGGTSTVSVRLKTNGGLAFDNGELYATGGGGGTVYTFDGESFSTVNSTVSLKPATDSTLGGIIVGDGLEVTQAGTLTVDLAGTDYYGGFQRWSGSLISDSSVNSASSISNKYYPVEVTYTGKLCVNVPWSGGSGGTTYTAGTGISISAQNVISADMSAISSGINLSDYLPLAGGTMTGTINSRALVPTSDRTYSLGSSSYSYDTLYIDTIVLTNGSNTVNISLNQAGDVLIDGNLVVTGAVTAAAAE